MSSSYKRIFEIMRSFKVNLFLFLHGYLSICVRVYVSECRYLQKPKMLDPIKLELQVKHRICKPPSHHFFLKNKVCIKIIYKNSSSRWNLFVGQCILVIELKATPIYIECDWNNVKMLVYFRYHQFRYHQEIKFCSKSYRCTVLFIFDHKNKNTLDLMA